MMRLLLFKEVYEGYIVGVRLQPLGPDDFNKMTTGPIGENAFRMLSPKSIVRK